MGIVSGIVASSGGTDTSDATAEAWEIKTGKTAYISTGSATGTGYFPAAMVFNGTNSYYTKTQAVSGNKLTAILRVKISSQAGAADDRLFACVGTGGTRFSLDVGQASNADADFVNRLRFGVQNTAGTNICRLFTAATVADGGWHTIFAEFDGDAGTGALYLDGASSNNTGASQYNAPTTGTVVNASTVFSIGATSTGGALAPASIGFIGYRDIDGLTVSNFVQTDGTPKELDESGWTEWGAQPLFWHESGLMTENKGSAGAMTANGTIILASASTWS